MATTDSNNGAARIVRTERGLTINGTRKTLYSVMDYVVKGESAEVIKKYMLLTDAEVNAALEYIAANRAQVEAEYQQVLQYAAETRRYWEERNKDVIARIRSLPPLPGKEALRQKLLEQRARTESES